MDFIIYKIYRFLLELLEMVLSALNSLVKKRKRILFYNQELRDNSKYLMEFVVNMEEYQVICYTSKAINNKIYSDKICYINSIFKLFFYYLTSKIVIFSFDLRFKIKPSKNQKIIQLWHGSPLKTIGNDQENYKVGKQRARYFSFILCTNELFINIYKQSFGCLDNQIKIWGNPRNDLLFKPLKYNEVFDLINQSYNKIILWMPTYRQSRILHNKEDSSLNMPIINKQNLLELNDYLKEKDCVIVIKPHPLQNQLISIINHYTNIILIDDNSINKKGYELYSLISAADALITDYSSVYFDYLLLDKPIGFAIEDIDEYKEKRGFVFNNPELYMPGPKLYTIEDLKVFIDNLIDGNDYTKTERNTVCNLANYYKDNKNCKRIYEEMKLILDQVKG